MLRVAMSNEPDRDKRRALEETRLRLLDEHLNPVYLEAAQIDREAVAAARRAELLRALQEVRLPARRARRRVPRRCSTRPRSSGSARATGSSARGSASASPTRGRGTCRASSARPSSTSSIPSDRMVPALESTLGDLGIDLRSQANVASRPREPAVEVAARVLRADRGSRPRDARDPADRRQGRLGGALPRGRPHRALRAHERRPVDGGAPPRRHGGHRRLGGAARAPRHRSCVAEPTARRAASARHRSRRRGLAPLLRPPLLREAALRDRVLPGRRPDVDAAALLRDPQRRAQASGQPPRATSTTSTAAST